MILLVVIIQISTAAPTGFHLSAGIGYAKQAYPLEIPHLPIRASLLIAPKPFISERNSTDIMLGYRPLTENKNQFLKLLQSKPTFEGWQNILSVRDAISVDTTRQGANQGLQNNENYIE